MSDIVERLRHCSENCGDEYLRELTGKAADTITRLTAEIEKLKADLAFADAQCVKVEGLFLGTHKENEKLRAALVRWLDAINDKRAFEHHHPDDLGKEWSRLREAVDLAEDNARAELSGDKQ